MIYVVTNQIELFKNDSFEIITKEQALDMISKCNVLQYDCETTGTCPEGNLDKIICFQIGSKKYDFQIVIDNPYVTPEYFKEPLQKAALVGQNLKFDIKFLYNYGIIPTKVYDTMIVEQLLYLGYPAGKIKFGLDSLVERYLPDQKMSKEVRGQIIWRGLDFEVIKYAAHDVELLEDIMWKQVAECKKKQCLKGAELECSFVPVIAYLEWCGIHLDEGKWREKMKSDSENLEKCRKVLDNWLIEQSFSKTEKVKTIVNYKTVTVPMVSRNTQGDLFNGFDLDYKCNVNWDSSKQVVAVAKLLGFNTSVISKTTGKESDSVLEKHLKAQKGINDEFLKMYFDYKEFSKVTTTYGQGHINQINPITSNIHTEYWQLGAMSGRMSCGSNKANITLAKYKGISPKDCTYANMQQLPADEKTRSCFTAHKGNLIVSCDWSSLEARLGADIYNEHSMIKEYLEGSGDMHSLMAIVFFGDKMEPNITTKEVKKKYPNLRKAAKSPEFLIQFGGGAQGLATQLAISEEEAQKYVDSYYNKFSGIAEFKKKGSKFVREYGYVLMNSYTGHKMYWWDHKEWLNRQNSFTKEFWDNYKLYHKGTGDSIAVEVSKHFKAASKWDRMALNGPTQGTGVNCLKLASYRLFKWIVDNNYFNKIKISALVHDEIVCEFPEELKETFPKLLEQIMLEAAAEYCKKLPIPAEASVGKCWIH